MSSSDSGKTTKSDAARIQSTQVRNLFDLPSLPQIYWMRQILPLPPGFLRKNDTHIFPLRPKLAMIQALALSPRVPRLRPIRISMKLATLTSLRSLKPMLEVPSQRTPRIDSLHRWGLTRAQKDLGERTVGETRGPPIEDRAWEDACFTVNEERSERWKF